MLGTLSEHRQVVVFTHDSRLPEVVSRLEIDADVLEVTRAEQSVVTIWQSTDPVAHYLSDAYAVARSEISKEVRGPVVTELCRSALEAAFHRIIWRSRLARGVRHTEIEEALDRARRTTSVAALALFDDRSRGSEVMSRINRHGRRFGDAFKACRDRVHNGYAGDLVALVNDVRDLVKVLS